MTRALAGGFGVLLPLALVLAPAAPAEKPPVFQVDLEMTNVTVTVHDASGGVVGDLAAEDFVVREDGRRQEIQVFGSAAEQVHAGERSARKADLHCTRCPEVVRVEAGQTVPECPNGHRTFDLDERKELSLNLGMLFDTSGSMRKELQLSKESAIRFLDAIPRAKDLLLVFFDRDIRLSRYDSENQQGIFERILESEGGGETALNDAIAVYLSRVMDTPGRKVLVLFTDGDDTTSRTGMDEIERMVRSSGVTIYPVAFEGERPASSFGALRARAFLAGLAADSGGRVFQPRASRDLARIYQAILDELGAQYVLGYVSDNRVRDGRFRKLAVEVKRPGLRVQCRPGYLAPKG